MNGSAEPGPFDRPAVLQVRADPDAGDLKVVGAVALAALVSVPVTGGTDGVVLFVVCLALYQIATTGTK